MRFGTRSSWLIGSAVFAALALSGAGCDQDNGNSSDVVTGDVPAATLAIAGSYTDTYGGTHDISSDTWTQTSDFGTGPVVSVYHLTKFDNAAKWVVGSNDAANGYNPGKWSRFDWATAGGKMYFCQTAFDAADEAAAMAVAAADATDPAAGGCGGFPWTPLTAVVK